MKHARPINSPVAIRLVNRALLSCVCVMVFSTSLVEAEDKTSVYVVSTTVEPELEAVAARVGAAARVAMRNSGQVAWQDADRKFLGYDADTLKTIQAARSSLQEGKEAYLDVEFEAAIDKLETAVGHFDNAAVALEDPTDFGEALMYLAACYAYNGEANTSRDVFIRLHRQFGHLKPDPDVFNPQIVEQYNAAAPKRRNALLEIESEPSGAVAFVDFVARGETPMKMEGLVPGEHLVRVMHPGSEPYMSAVNLKSRRTLNLKASLEESAGGLATRLREVSGQSLETAEGPLSDVAKLLAVNVIGVVRVSYGDTSDQVKLELMMFNTANGRRLLRAEGPAPKAIGKLGPAVRRLVTGALSRLLNSKQASDDESPIGPMFVEDTVTQRPVNEAITPVYKRWWFWTIIGVAAAGTAVLTWYLVKKNQPGQDSDPQLIFKF